MANEAQNRLTLKVGITLDQSTATREWVRLQKEVNAMQSKLMDAQTKANRKASDSVQNINKNLKQQKSFLQEVAGGWAKTLGGFVKFTLISSAFMAIGVTLKNITQTIVDLDTAMTNFNIVTKATGAEMAFVNERAGILANTLGVLKTEIIDATTEFARAGFTISDSMLLAENSIKAANAGGVELADIVTYVIAGLKSFKLEAAESARILDVLFSVANITAIDLEGIGEAFLRSANTLQTAGASLEESAALIAAANETIQDPAKVGTALKTIASRLRGVGEEGEIIPTLADDFKRIGIEIQNADGSFRDIYSIFSDFADVYKGLDDLTKQSLIEKIAGKRQANILIGLVENFDLADKSLQTALDSAGEIETANNKIMSSVGKQIDVLTNSFKAFYAALSTPESLATLVHVLTAVVDGLTLLINNLDKVLIAFGSTLIGIYALTSGFTGLGVSIGILTGIAAPWMYIVGGIAVALGSYSLITADAKKKTDELAGATEKLTEKQRENQQVVESGNLKAQKKLADELQKQIDIIDKLVKSYDDLGKSAPADSMFGSNLGIQEFATDLNKANQAISAAELQLSNMGYTVEEARAYIASLNIETKDLTVAQLDMAEANFQVKQIISSTSDEYQVLSDALQQLEIDGYLTDDMLNTLIETYPNLVTETGLQVDAIEAYIKMDRAAREQVIRSTRANMVDKIREAQTEVDAQQTKINAIKAYMTAIGGGSYGAGIGLTNAQTEITNAKAQLQDAKNNIALLDNELSQLADTDVRRTAAIKASREETEKEEVALTSLERELKRINQEIAINQQLQARTSDKEEQIKLNEQLIQLYIQQKSTLEKSRLELEANNKSIKVGDKGYDDYIDKLYEFSLAIEQAETSIVNSTYAIRDLNKELASSKLEGLQEKLIGIIKDANDLAKESAADEIKRIQKAIDVLEDKNDADQESLDILKEQYEFNKKLSELNESISQAELESALLSTDNSLESQRRRAELAEELVQLNKEKADEITQYGFTQQERALEAEFKASKEALEKELKLAEDTLDQLTTAGEKAIDKISNAGIESIGELQLLLATFTEEGSLDGLDGAWATIIGKVKEYITLLSSVNLSGGVPSNSTSNIDSMYNQPATDAGKSNQQKYLENLIATGTAGQAAWAKAQLGITSAKTTPAPTTSAAGSTKVGTAINIENMNNTIGSSYDMQKVGADLATGSMNVLQRKGYTLMEK